MKDDCGDTKIGTAFGLLLEQNGYTLVCPLGIPGCYRNKRGDFEIHISVCISYRESSAIHFLDVYTFTRPIEMMPTIDGLIAPVVRSILSGSYKYDYNDPGIADLVKLVEDNA